MRYRVVFKPLTEMSDQMTKRVNPHLQSAEDIQEAVIDAVNENHAVQVFMNLVQHAGLKVAQYRLEPLEEEDDPNEQIWHLPVV